MKGRAYWVCRRCSGKEYGEEVAGVENVIDSIMMGRAVGYSALMHHPCKDGHIGVIELQGAEISKEPVIVSPESLPEMEVVERESSTPEVVFAPPEVVVDPKPVGPKRRGRPSNTELAMLKG